LALRVDIHGQSVGSSRAARVRSALVAAVSAAAALAFAGAAAAEQCRGHVYLTLDTGNMRHAEEIAAILRRHDVRATFFLANEKTPRGDSSLDPSWSAYWKARADEGHAFGSHTWRHGRFVADEAAGVRYRPQFGDDAGRTITLEPAAVCAELRRVDKAFTTYAGRGLDALWRAPGGHTTPRALAAAKDCGFAHVGWAQAGFLGDELPSDRYPNEMLLARALRDIRNGDVLMAHLGIWSRKEPFAPMLEPVIAGLKERGLCFRTLREHPDYRAQAPVLTQLAASAAPRR
jgi:peptidoglycan/xylan/chitin deacetylase (PgdA/CDA1 family)